MKILLSVFLVFVTAACAHSSKSTVGGSPSQLIGGKAAIEKMAGCYLVDYNYSETEALKPGYKRDARLYDVNKNKSVKEWIYLEEVAPQRVRLQHILFATDARGQVMEGSRLKHQAEDWEFAAPFRYDYVGSSRWNVTPLPAGAATWTRKVTNLDDGLRYQCSANWKLDAEFPDWSCDGYAPIPGRETRDMSRKDYQGLQRSTRIIVYGGNWLERQENTKMVDNGSSRVPLAKGWQELVCAPTRSRMLRYERLHSTAPTVLDIAA